jgi:hypothetical protein
MNRISLLLPALLISSCVQAQQIKAVLVQLSSEQNRIQYAKAHNRTHDVAETSYEAKKVRQVTTRDFKDNFTYCPVYYYIDTNRDYIRNKQFDGVLLDDSCRPVANGVMNGADNDYIVVYYGFSEDSKSTATDHKGLVVLDDQFHQIYYIFKSQISSSVEDQKVISKYSYQSPKYDIDYSPHAEKLNDKMEKIEQKLQR